jgi:hypothetical protein
MNARLFGERARLGRSGSRPRAPHWHAKLPNNLARPGTRIFAAMARRTAAGAAALPIFYFLSSLLLAAQTLHGNFIGGTERPVRYFPDHGDFVITNGAEFFNRPLYCDHSAFRIDGGDKPEFSLYVPGRGGNLRFGIKTSAGAKWLNDADKIVTRYRAGELIYEINDRLLVNPTRTLRLTVLPLNAARGVVVRAELTNAAWLPVELFWAFGGANGMRGRRGGDIGCEAEPVSKFFQLRPEQCAGNEFSVEANSFLLQSKVATICGIGNLGASFSIGDATFWNDPAALLASSGSPAKFPLVAGRAPLSADQPIYFALEDESSDGDLPIEIPFAKADALLPKLFSDAEKYRREVADRVVIETPDPFINAAAPALNIAADAIWDERQQSFMHGAVAWRVRLLGWRGPYAGDALGWHDRTAEHFIGFAKQQNTNPIPEKIPPADESANLARNEAALHSNGDLTHSHYDMNLVGMDAFFRHLLWTGDLDFARTNWLVIERHFAWEHRLFRREFGEDKLPLYEAYAAIWASDNLSYNGGGATHASAYNYWHNKMAARVAGLIGKNPAPYEREADLILRGMQKYLWVKEQGTFAEYKDYLGLQLVHPNAGLWTFYHAMDCEVPTPEQAWRMSRRVDANIARIPILKNSELRTLNSEFPSVLPETSWMPYEWSLNNVVVAENIHTSLGYWQANRPDAAFQLFKSALLETMFLGLCPGNLGAMTQHDAARGESQRDFGDAIGITSRTLVEGLFGVKPDALAGELKIVPGFPVDWRFAKIAHPDFNFEFRREDVSEIYSIESKFRKPMKLILQLPAYTDWIGGVYVNGEPAHGKFIEGIFGRRRIEIQCEPATKWTVRIEWKGNPAQAADIAPANEEHRTSNNQHSTTDANAFDWRKKFPADVKFETLNLAPFFNDRVTQIFKNDYRSPRSPFCSLAVPKNGIGGWADNRIQFDVDDSGLRNLAAKNSGRIILPDGVPFAIATNSDSENIIFTSQWDNYPREVSVPVSGKSSRAFLLMAGSTGPMQSQFDNGEIIVSYTDGSTARLALRNPTNWWPIEQDYFADDFAFRRDAPMPPRVDLKTGAIRILDTKNFKGRGGKIPGGAATVLELPLDENRNLKSVTIRALANETVVGLMAVTLER